MSDDETRRRAEYLLATIEGRRAQADGFAWSVPGLTIAAQAFLLSIALAPDTTPAGRLIASLAGLVLVLATGHLMAKQVYVFDLYEGVIERERRKLSLPGLQTDILTAQPFPQNTLMTKRWLPTERRSRWGRRTFVVGTKVVWVWLAALVVLAAIDVFLVGYSGWAWWCGDPGWLAPQRP